MLEGGAPAGLDVDGSKGGGKPGLVGELSLYKRRGLRQPLPPRENPSLAKLVLTNSGKREALPRRMRTGGSGPRAVVTASGKGAGR